MLFCQSSKVLVSPEGNLETKIIVYRYANGPSNGLLEGLCWIISLSRDLLAATELKLEGKGSDAFQPVAIQLFSNLQHTHTCLQLFQWKQLE